MPVTIDKPTVPAPDAVRLQGIADAATSAGAVVVRVSSRPQIVEQLDKKGRNRAASWSICTACQGARELKAADGLWDDCDACGGEGAVIESVPTVSVPMVQVIAGNTTHELPLLSGEGRADTWTPISQTDVDAFVQAAAARHAQKG
jgi:hypothetical protein